MTLMAPTASDSDASTGNSPPSDDDYQGLRQRLADAEAALHAIQSGKVDALVVAGPNGQQVYTLKSADEPYRLLIEQMQEAALTLNDAGMILFCNQFFAQLTGHPHSQIVGRFLSDFLATADGLGMAELLRAALHGPVVVRVTLVATDGRLVPIKLALNAMPGDDFKGVCAVATDLTEREEMNRAIEAERLTSAVLEATSDGVLMCDDSGRIIRANDHALRLFGATCLNRHIDDICHLALPFGQLTAAQAPFAQGIERQLVVDGRCVDVLCGIRRLASAELSVSGWVITLSDITSQKEMERTLQAADQRKDEFLAVLGHELRNPLAGIANGVMLLQRGGATADQVHWTHRMLGDQVQHLARLLNDLLDLTRIKQQKIRLEKLPVDMVAIVHKSVASVVPLIETRAQTLTLELPARPAWVLGDATRLEQIVSNLLVNGAKYTGRGGAIRVELTVQSGAVYLRVRDNGIGLAPEMRQRVFEPFMQVAALGSQSGLGIGLSLARRLVKLHGGEITVTSAGLNQGSEFIVRLPETAAQAADESGNVGRTLPDVQPGVRVLIVDDNQDAVRCLEILLQDAGCEVHAAYDGASALAEARAHAPEVVLLDIGLPDMDGYQVAAALRAERALRSTLLIAVSGFGNDEAQQRARDARFDRYLVKPVDHAELLTLVSRASAGLRPDA